MSTYIAKYVDINGKICGDTWQGMLTADKTKETATERVVQSVAVTLSLEILFCAQSEAAHGDDGELAVNTLEVLLYGQVLVPDILLREQA